MNMMLAGLIASSYSYDHAISEEEELKIDVYKRQVPELPQVYPEPENWGILPAYGLYLSLIHI